MSQAEEEPRPWEQQGAVRRDVAPHRGPLLLLLGGTTLAVGLTSFCLIYSGLLALPLAVGVELLIRRDQGRMANGRMDPRGWDQAETARKLAWAGAAAGFLVGFFCAWPFWDRVEQFIR